MERLISPFFFLLEVFVEKFTQKSLWRNLVHFSFLFPRSVYGKIYPEYLWRDLFLLVCALESVCVSIWKASNCNANSFRLYHVSPS